MAFYSGMFKVTINADSAEVRASSSEERTRRVEEKIRGTLRNMPTAIYYAVLQSAKQHRMTMNHSNVAESFNKKMIKKDGKKLMKKEGTRKGREETRKINWTLFTSLLCAL